MSVPPQVWREEIGAAAKNHGRAGCPPAHPANPAPPRSCHEEIEVAAENPGIVCCRPVHTANPAELRDAETEVLANPASSPSAVAEALRFYPLSRAVAFLGVEETLPSSAENCGARNDGLLALGSVPVRHEFDVPSGDQ